MSQNHNTNFTNLSLRTDSTVELIRELSKLGVFKSKRKTRPGSSRAADVRQASDMVGYVKALSNIGAPNVSLDQLEDIQRRNDAALATLRGEVSQQRLADIEEQQGQRMSDIYRLGSIINPVLERFRGSQEPSESRLAPIINVNALPDVQEERFTESINEGGPEATEARQTGIFAEAEGEQEQPLPPGVAFEEIPQVEKKPTKKGGASVESALETIKQRNAKKLNVKFPPPTKGAKLQTIKQYYITASQNSDETPDSSIFDDKAQMLREINRILSLEETFIE